MVCIFCIRLTIRNVNNDFLIERATPEECIRLTIRNVNIGEEIYWRLNIGYQINYKECKSRRNGYATKPMLGIRLTIRNVNEYFL